MPIIAGVAPTNTRAIIAVWFDDAGVLNRLEVERFFERPFVNDYWFRLKDLTQNPLKALARIAESLEYKVVGVDEDAGGLRLEDGRAGAFLAVTLSARVLRVTSKNPHDRLGTEYRVYRKRETAFIDGIVNSGLVQ